MPGSKPSGSGLESHDALFGPRSSTKPAGDSRRRAALDPGDRDAIYRRTLNFQSKLLQLNWDGTVGWWVRVVTQQALLSGHPGPKLHIQPFGLNLKKRYLVEAARVTKYM